MTVTLASRERELLLDEFRAMRPQAASAIALFDEGATLPFIARYRKERTGGLTETQLKEIQDRLAFHAGLVERKATILESIREQGSLSPELERNIVECTDRRRLEDLYLPYKPKRRTRAELAREKGFGPLAEEIWAHRPASGNPEAMAGASDILAERISEQAATRDWIRRETLARGRLSSRRKRGAPAERSKFDLYLKFTQPLSRIASHQALAVFRGESEGFLSVSIEVDAAPILAHLDRLYHRPGSPHGKLFRAIEADAYERLLAPSLQNEIRAIVRERAEEEATRVFAENLRNLLLAPPVRDQAILGIDPGLRTGCKVAVVDRTGKFIGSTVIHPDRPEAAPALAALILTHGVGRIAYGNGTGSRELEAFLRRSNPGIPFVSVSEAGASVYSASDAAVREFGHLDVTVRGAISIARRLQDPLAELVKIDPKAIGVGQYQHDVDQEKLQRELDHVVESCVNQVGVDLNTASPELLSYVAGLTPPIAQAIVARRPFRSREELLTVPRLGPRTYEQAAGFLRIPGAENPLDASAVHPESYPLVERIARTLGRPVRELIARDISVRLEDFVDERVGLPTLRDILEELQKPGRDPRREFLAANFDPDVTSLEHVKAGMLLEG
ncbi:MAG TPA: Tex-like N-terminal domain-containing protein, partial [Planctomycetota bacterium]|nr:Tex-like N-terminal domain-containing protein [Planctomycetota bacterium]